MRDALKRRPSPAMIVAIAALAVALVGTAIAAPIAVNSVLNKPEKKQVRKIATKRANKAITKRAPGLSVKNASSANNANSVDGLSAAKFQRTYTTTTSFENVLDFAGLQIRARCVDNGGVVVDDAIMEARTTINDSTATVGTENGGDLTEFNQDQDFDTGQSLNLRPGDHSATTGTLNYVDPSTGAVVTVNYQVIEVVLGFGCRLSGVAVGG